MRSPLARNLSIWLGCLLMAITCSSALGAQSGAITGVSLDPGGQTLVISLQGDIGKHLARVIGRPNRLVIDFEDVLTGKVPHKIKVEGKAIHEIRVGDYRGKARVVVDFQQNPVPAFKIHRDRGRVAVAFGRTFAGGIPAPPADAAEAGAGPAPKSPLAPDFRPAAAHPAVQDEAGTDTRGPAAPPVSPGSPKKALGVKEVRLAQSMALNVPPRQPVALSAQGPGSDKGVRLAQGRQPAAPPTPDDSAAPMPPSVSGPRSYAGPGVSGRMVREVRPPVTPPTPDPRLVVQEITELRFIQVGHNSRLVIRGGDHLDYRLNKVSPTKVRVDLINAEIPKAHQKPLRTDLFSTSVEMIVPGSQSIFIQLKDAVPYQVQKKKGVLMIDFPAPRFAMTDDQRAILAPKEGEAAGKEAFEKRREALMAKREAARILKEEEARRRSETIGQQISTLLKEQEELLKERRELERRYKQTPDPEVFNKPVTMDFQGISLRNAFRLLAEQAGLNIIVGNEVAGTTTLRLFQVPLGQVVDHLLKTNRLDRDLVGNVMWIGSEANIKKAKDLRKREHRLLVTESDKKIAAIKKQIKDLEREREKALQEAAKEAAADEEAPTQTTEFETVGATETITIQGEPVTLLLVRVKLNYAKAKEVKTILDCVFNRKCAGVQQTGAELTEETLEREQEQLEEQGFQRGSPGAQARIARKQQQLEASRRTEAAEAVAQQPPVQRTTVAQALASLRGAAPMDRRMQEILAHTVLWSSDEYNMLFIKDLPERIEEMKKLIATLDVPVPQVMVEARLVQATRDWSRGLGVIWGASNNQMGTIRGNRTAMWGVSGLTSGGFYQPTGDGILPGTNLAGYAVNLPATVTGGTVMGVGIQFGLLAADYATDLAMQLQLGEASGKTKIIARPKVQVIDGKKASIKNGRKIAYYTVSADGTQTQLVNVDLLLEVTPKIFPDGRIQMNLNVKDNDVGDVVNGLASIITRESKTIMIVRDGETAVIGGILRKTDNSSRRGYPGLMNIPILAGLFSNKTARKNVQELLIFITPTIVKRPPSAS